MNNRLTLDYGLRFVHQGPQYDTHGFASQFFENRWDPAKRRCCTSPVRPRLGVAVHRAELRAMNPVTGQVLGAGSSALVGQMVPGTGIRRTGSFRRA